MSQPGLVELEDRVCCTGPRLEYRESRCRFAAVRDAELALLDAPAKGARPRGESDKFLTEGWAALGRLLVMAGGWFADNSKAGWTDGQIGGRGLEQQG
jgi:hypothetical protein